MRELNILSSLCLVSYPDIGEEKDRFRYLAKEKETDKSKNHGHETCT